MQPQNIVYECAIPDFFMRENRPESNRGWGFSLITNRKWKLSVTPKSPVKNAKRCWQGPIFQNIYANHPIQPQTGLRRFTNKSWWGWAPIEHLQIPNDHLRTRRTQSISLAKRLSLPRYWWECASSTEYLRIWNVADLPVGLFCFTSKTPGPNVLQIFSKISHYNPKIV